MLYCFFFCIIGISQAGTVARTLTLMQGFEGKKRKQRIFLSPPNANLHFPQDKPDAVNANRT